MADGHHPIAKVDPARYEHSAQAGALWLIAQTSSARVLLVNSPKVVRPRDPGYTDWFHIALPLRGSFLWQDGMGDVLAGPNHVLFVPAAREFRIAHPVQSDLSLVIAPRRAEAERIARFCGVDPHVPSFRTLSGTAQLGANQLVWAAQRGASDFELEQLVLDLLEQLRATKGQRFASFDASARRTITRAKEYLHANLDQPVTLTDVADAVGANAVYLTNLFKTKEGVPLHKYLLWLRLASGLASLPDASDLSALAHELGFSSHSHLSSSFRARFDRSPARLRNAFRAMPRSRNFELLPLCAARSGDSRSAS